MTMCYSFSLENLKKKKKDKINDFMCYVLSV